MAANVTNVPIALVYDNGRLPGSLKVSLCEDILYFYIIINRKKCKLIPEQNLSLGMLYIHTHVCANDFVSLRPPCRIGGFHSVVAITSASHAEGPGFEPQ